VELPVCEALLATGLETDCDVLGSAYPTYADRFGFPAEPIINGVREQVDRWRLLPEHQWRVTPETARLLKHWRHHPFSGIRPFFCQVEAVETAIWLIEVAPQVGKLGSATWSICITPARTPTPGLSRLALKLATGAGKTTVMAMLIAWQSINAARRPQSKRFSRGFLIVAPTAILDIGLTLTCARQ